MKRLAGTIALVLGLGCAVQLHADIVFPARLEVVEVEPGLFQVTFQLPVVNGRFPSAEALFPDGCAPLGDQAQSFTNSSYTRSWMMRCDSEVLYGQVIQIRGLLGTNVDVVFQLDLLNSRRYSTLLRPGRSTYLIPRPPTWTQMAGIALPKGMKSLLGQYELWLLLILFVFSFPGRALAARAMALFMVGFILSAWLAGQQWLQMWSGWAVVAAMISGAFLALGLTRYPLRRSGGLFLFLPAAFLIGFYYGSAYDAALAWDGLSVAELRAGFFLQVFGVGLGLAILFALLRSLRQGLLQSGLLSPSGTWRRQVGYAGGILSVAFLFYWMSSPVWLPSLWPDWTFSFFLALPAVAWATSGIVNLRAGLFGTVLVCLAAGLCLGGAEVELPLSGLWFALSVFALGGLCLVRPRGSAGWILFFSGLALLTAGSENGRFIREELSFPVAHMVAAGALALGLIFLLRQSMRVVLGKWPFSYRLAGGLLIGLALLDRLLDYRDGWREDFLGNLAQGELLLPGLVLPCLLLALFLWPRQHRVAEQLGVRPSTGYGHWIFLALAFFLLPLGNFRVPNPLFQGGQQDSRITRQKLEESLRQTYLAFNIKDDEALYDALSKSVSENLIADIYLDSRRRLSEGVREGAEVSVRSVEVLELGEGSALHAYSCTWSVIARVRHLQHVHHRRNIYTGIIEVDPEAELWKIDKVALQSEERSIVPAPSG